MTVWELPESTVEWVGPFTVTFNGQPYDDAFQLGLLPCPTGATEWFTPDVEAAGKGFWVGTGGKQLQVGRYRVRIKTSGGVIIDGFATITVY